jgi:WD40 repeat protein
VLAVSFVGLALVGGVIGTTWGLLSATAESTAKEAVNTLLRGEKRQAQVNFSTLLLDRGLEECERGEVGLGLLLLARSLEEAPADAADLQRVIRINLAAWSHQTSHLRGIFPQDPPLENAFLSPDGTTLLMEISIDRFRQRSERRIDRVQLWDTATGQLRGEIKGEPCRLWPGGQGSQAAFTPDGKRILMNSGQFHDTATCEPAGKPIGRGNFAFSADSKVVLFVGRDQALSFWDVTTGQPLGEPIRFAYVSFNLDRRIVGTVSQDSKSARFWDIASGRPIGQPLPLPGPTSWLALSPDGRMVLTLTQGKTQAQLWDTATGQAIGQPLTLPEPIQLAGFSLDGKMVGMTAEVENEDGVRQNHFQLWDATGWPLGGLTPMNNGPGTPSKLMFHAPGLFTLRADSPSSRFPSARLHGPHRTSPYYLRLREQKLLALTPGGAIFLVRWELGPDLVRNTDTGEALGPPLPSPHADLSPVFSSDLRTYVTPGSDDGHYGVRWDGSPRLWKAGEGKPDGQTLPGPDFGPGPNTQVAFSTNARFLLAAHSAPRGGRIGAAGLDLYDRTGGSLGRVTGEEFDVIRSPLAAAFSPDGRLVLASVRGNKENELGPPLGGTQLWAAEGGKLTSRWEGVGVALAFSPDGKRFAEGGAPDDARVATDRRAVRLWDVATLKPSVAPLEHPAPVHAVAFSPDGTTLLTGCGNHPDSPLTQGGEARLWDAATGQPRGDPLPHQGAVVAVAFRPDGKTVLTGSTDRTARLWDAATGRQLGPSLAHRDTVTSVAFRPDSRLVMTASRDGTSRLWDAATGKPLGPPLPHRHEDTNHTFVAFGPDEQSVLTAGRDGELTRWQVETAPVAGDVERVRLWVQVLTGTELDGERVAGSLSRDTWGERRRRLEELGGPPLP